MRKGRSVLSVTLFSKREESRGRRLRGMKTCILKCTHTQQVGKAKEMSGHGSWELRREDRAQDIKFQAAIPQTALKLAEELSQEGVTRREKELGQD